MKRKLIDFDVFNQLKQNSLTSAEYELSEAESIISHALGKDVEMHCLSESTVIYKTPNDTYVHANYKLGKNGLTLENIEELVIDESQERKQAKNILNQMVDKLIEGEELQANGLFNEYVSMPFIKRVFNESKTTRKKKCCTPKNKKCLDAKCPNYKKWNKAKKGTVVVKEDTSNILKNISENILKYAEYRRYGPTLNECSARYDEKGNLNALHIPTAHARNEGKILKLKYNTLTHELIYHRSAGKSLSENVEFCSAIAELKRQNAFNDSNALQESLETIVTQWPNVIYLSQNELAKILGNALEQKGIKSYDDQTCNFMAEGILRTAYDVHKDKVDKVLKLAKNTECQGYDCFQETVEEFYSHIDESTSLEMQAFYDLYSAVGEIYNQSKRSRDEIVQEQAESFMRDLHAVCEGQITPDIELAEEVAEWIQYLIETNLETKSWAVSNTPHHTTSGDHPRMAQNAATGYAPKNDFSGNWGDTAPVSDGKNYKSGLSDQMRSRSWGNVGGPDTFPSLSNPYVPKPFGDYTMKGEPSVDKNADSGLTQVQNVDTWPNLQNPYVPKSETPETYKMNQGKETDLVIDQ